MEIAQITVNIRKLVRLGLTRVDISLKDILFLI